MQGFVLEPLLAGSPCLQGRRVETRPYARHSGGAAARLNCNGRPTRKGTQKPRQNARTIIRGEESA